MWKMWKVKMTAPFFTGRIFFRRSGPGGGGLAGACRRDNSSANRSPAPAHRDPLGYGRISPIGGASLIKGFDLYAYRRDVREKVCSHLRWRKFYENLVSTARRRGVPFTRVKGTKTRLGRCPKTPVACSAGYGFVFPSMIRKNKSVLRTESLPR